MITDLRILELMASKICHDLVSPVGAINNGVELIEDIGGDVVSEAMQLISSSAEQAARRLRIFRIAYGRSGSDSNLTFKDAHDTLLAHFEFSKIKLHFADNCPHYSFIETRGALRNLINLTILAEETLIYGGDIHCRAHSDTLNGMTITASGRGAHLSEASCKALDNTAATEDISARTIHAHLTGRFIALHDFDYALDNTASDHVTFHLTAKQSDNPQPVD
jgi:histidine phosphotransferase ChpT